MKQIFNKLCAGDVNILKRNSPIMEASVALQNNYNPTNAIKYGSFLRKQPVKALFENAGCFYTEPVVGSKLFNRVLLVAEPTLESLTELSHNLSTNISHLEREGQRDSEHLSELKESLTFINNKIIKMNTPAYLKENTIVALVSKYASPTLESLFDDTLDEIVLGIDSDSLYYTDQYISIIQELEKDETELRMINPVIFLAKNTAIVLGGIREIVGSDLDLILSIPCFIACAIMDNRFDRSLSFGFIHVIDSEIGKVQDQLSYAEPEDQKLLTCYIEKLREAQGKLAQFNDENLSKSPVSEGIGDMQADVVYQDEPASQIYGGGSPDVTVVSNFKDDNCNEYLFDDPDEGSNPDDDDWSDNFGPEALLKDFAITFVDTFMDDSPDINMESFTKLIRISNALEILTEDSRGGVLRKAALKGEGAVKDTIHGVRHLVDKSKHVTTVLQKIPQHVDNAVNNTIDSIRKMDSNERRERLIQGGIRLKLFKIIRNAIVIGGIAWLVSPALAAITFLASFAVDKSLDAKVREQVLNELEEELRIVNEKVEDAKGDSDRNKKYQLMRIKIKLENDVKRIKYNLRVQ